MHTIDSIDLGQFQVMVYPERPDFEFLEVNQVHGTDVVNSLSAAKDVSADGMFSLETPCPPMAIKTADCLPIVVIGKEGASHLHAGWRGVCDGIIEKDEIRSLSPQVIYIGPHIKSCCFEVSDDFSENFIDGKQYERRCENMIFFSLLQYITDRIKKIYPNCEIIHSKDCTCCNHKYNSYRRNKTSIRNWNILQSKDKL